MEEDKDEYVANMYDMPNEIHVMIDHLLEDKAKANMELVCKHFALLYRFENKGNAAFACHRCKKWYPTYRSLIPIMDDGWEHIIIICKHCWRIGR